MDHLGQPKPLILTAPEILGSAYFYYILQLMSRFAVISGNTSDQRSFLDLAAKMKRAFNAKYFNPVTNRYGN